MLLLMIDIICKLLVLLKNHLNYLKDNLSECFFNKYIYIKKVLLIFFMVYNDEKSKV